MVSVIESKGEYDTIYDYLKNGEINTSLTKHQTYRLRKKAENFIIIDEVLYLKVRDTGFPTLF
jgi:hypothetical protein